MKALQSLTELPFLPSVVGDPSIGVLMSQEPLDSEPERGSNRGLRHFRDAASTRGRPRVRSFVEDHRNREDGLVGGDLKVVWNFNILHLLDSLSLKINS